MNVIPKKRTSWNRYLSTSALIKAALPLTFMALIANPAQAQIAFDRTAGTLTGGIDVDGDGVFTDGSWEIVNNGQGLNAFNITPAGGIATRYKKNSGSYTVNTDFTATLTDPEVTFQLGVFGNEGLGQTYEAKATSYQVSWTGITGTADIIDPNPPTYVEDQVIDSSIVHTPNSVSIEQTFPTPGVVPNNCTWSSAGNWRNFCLEWGILAPNGATALNIVAAGGTAREGYRFSAISYADLIVNKSVSDATLAVGDAGFFTITLENNNISGNSVALNTKLTDILPAGLSYTSEVISSDGANTGGSYDSATGIWNIGRVSLGETVELQINFTVDSGTEGTTLTNTIDPVTITSSQTDPTDNNGSLSAQLAIAVPEADLVTVKSLASSDSTPAVGDTVTFEIIVTNNGGDDATGVNLTDLIPDGLTATTNNGTVTGGGSYDDTSGLWTIGNLANGATATLTIEGTVDAGQGGDTIANILANPAKGDQPDPTDDGNDLTETVIVEEEFVLPAFPSGTGLGDSVCNVSPATNPYQDIGVRWEFNNSGGTSPDASIDRGDIFASATTGSYVGISAQVNGFDLNINADSIPSAYNPNAYIEYQFTTNNFTDMVELRGMALTLFDKGNSSHNQATGSYHFAIAVDDDAAFTSPEVLINDVPLDGIDTSSAAAATSPSNTGQYLQTFAHWDPNGSTVSLNPSTTYTMRVYPYGVSEFGDDQNKPFSNIVLWDDFMLKTANCSGPTADLVTVKSLASSDSTPAVGDTVTFEIIVTNNGGDDATGVNLTDLIPDGLTATTNNGTVTGGGSYDDTSGLWTIGNLANGATATLTIEGTVDAGQNNKDIENITTIASGEQTDPTTDGDNLSASVSVKASADLSITITNTPGVNGEVDQADDTLAPGANTTYTVVVTNNGPDDATGAVVTDTPTSGLTCTGTNAVAITGDGVPTGSYTIADLTGTGIMLGTLADGDAATLSYECKVN